MKNIDIKILEKIFLEVQKPGRYAGGEFNTIIKENAKLKMGISFPDLYEIGMANNGIRILYDVVNRMTDASCERVFAVEGDFELKLRNESIPLYTLESYTPLCNLDLLGFNLASELLFTNMLQVLDLGQIPIFSADRSNGDPIVIAGGEAVSNPWPLAEFLDAIYIGDGEEGIIDIINSIINSKEKGINREEKISLLSEIDGVFVPGKYNAEYKNNKMVKISGNPVKQRLYKGNEFNNPISPIVPNVRITQERNVLEIARGCPNLCKFCHAGFYELPYRQHDYKTLADQVMSMMENTGYDELTISSLSVSDYSDLVNLLNEILPGLTEKGISISLPSLKVDKRTLPIIESISGLRKTSLTFAIESGSIELREIANKQVYEEDLIEIVDEIFNKGWRVLKLYFMLGLPGCDQYNEAEPIIRIIKKILSLSKSRKEIHVTLSPFVPKPHTPFQWEKQMGREYFVYTVGEIKKGLPKNVKIRSHEINASILEGVITRGDSRLAPVIYQSYMDGCRFDSWNEHFRFDLWLKNLNEILPQWNDFLSERSEDEVLPWSIVETGYEKLIESRKDHKINLNGKTSNNKNYSSELDIESIKKATEKFEQKYDTMKKVRLFLTKKGKLRFTSHIEYVEIIKRALRMSNAPVASTRGFNKREKLSTGFPLPLGIASESELIDIDLYDDLNSDFIETFNKKTPDGLMLVALEELKAKENLMTIVSIVEYKVKIDSSELIEKVKNNLERKISFIKKTKKINREVPFSDVIESFEFENNSLSIKIYTGGSNSMRIDRIMPGLAELEHYELDDFSITKIKHFKTIDGKYVQIEK